MTFIITIYVREGIVMASDSRLTLSRTESHEGQQIVHMAVGQSDTNYKTFLAPKGIGISTFGAADIKGVPIGGYIDSFINEHLSQRNYEVDQVPQELLTYFENLPGPPDTGFIVAGYKKVNNTSEQHIWQVLVSKNEVKRINVPGTQGATWQGETDIVTRLIKPVFVKDDQGNFQPIQHYQIQWNFFTLQDAIDYCIYAVKVTIDTMRFHTRPKTVGGSIDVLVIKPEKAWWIQRKELHV